MRETREEDEGGNPRARQMTSGPHTQIDRCVLIASCNFASTLSRAQFAVGAFLAIAVGDGRLMGSGNNNEPDRIDFLHFLLIITANVVILQSVQNFVPQLCLRYAME